MILCGYFFLLKSTFLLCNNICTDMNVLSKNDFLEVNLHSLIADYDRDTLTMLYQPLIGYSALSVYFTFWSQAKMQKENKLINHDEFFNRLQISCGNFVEARKLLEATGLIRTYISKVGDVHVYHYEVYAPKTPYNFFDDTLLYGMLIKILGDHEANELKNMFNIEKIPFEGTEISTNFQEVFTPCFDDSSFIEAARSNNRGAYSRNIAKVRSEFSYEKFFDNLYEVSHISSDSLLNKEVKEIERLSMLYGVNEKEAANAVTYVYRSNSAKGRRVDFDKLNYYLQNEANYSFVINRNHVNGPSLVSGKSDLATKINIMETVSPKDFISILQNGAKPASADLKIINSLSKDFNLPNCVINAVIDYVLTTGNNVFSKALAEKVAGSLARERITTTLDAMNYLKKVSLPKRGRKKNESIAVSNVNNTKTKQIQDNADNLDWDTLIDELDEEDCTDGKA